MYSLLYTIIILHSLLPLSDCSHEAHISTLTQVLERHFFICKLSYAKMSRQKPGFDGHIKSPKKVVTY